MTSASINDRPDAKNDDFKYSRRRTPSMRIHPQTIFALMSGAGIELHEAASMGEYDVLQDLLKSGKYDVNLRDPEWQNRTPLHWACTKGYVDCVRLLMDYRANGLIKMDMGWTPAHCAAEAGKLNCLRALHQCGVQLDVKDKYGDSPRRVAEIYGHAECVKFLTQMEEEAAEKRANGLATDKDDATVAS